MGKNDENQPHNITIVQEEEAAPAVCKYPSMTKIVGDFRLHVIGGEFTQSQIIVIQGLQGSGKTTLLSMLAGLLKPDAVDGEMPQFNVSYKPQKKINPMSMPPSVIVRDLFQDADNIDPHFETHVMQPLFIQQLMDQQVVNLSPTQLHRLELCLCLLKPADIYLIDELGQYLTPREGIAVANVIKSFILHTKKTAVVAESSLYMANFLYDRIILCDGKPSIRCIASQPQTMFFNLKVLLLSHSEEIIADPSNLSEFKGLVSYIPVESSD